MQREDFHCVEPMLLGMEEPEPILVSGLVRKNSTIPSHRPLVENLKYMEFRLDCLDSGREGFIEKVKALSKQLADEFDIAG